MPPRKELKQKNQTHLPTEGRYLAVEGAQEKKKGNEARTCLGRTALKKAFSGRGQKLPHRSKTADLQCRKEKKGTAPRENRAGKQKEQIVREKTSSVQGP